MTRYVTKRGRLYSDQLGALGEIAASRALGYPVATVVGGVDCGPYQVRTRSAERGALMLNFHRLNKPDKDSDVFVLVVMLGGHGDVITRRYRLVGWAWGWEVRACGDTRIIKPEYPPSTFYAQRFLHPLIELPRPANDNWPLPIGEILF